MRNLALSFALVIGLASSVLAEDAKPFSDAKEIDLVSLLPTPPANNSPQMQAELAEILTIQVTRTPEMAARAVADADEDVWRFADVIDNPKFTKENLRSSPPSSTASSPQKALLSIRPKISGSVRGLTSTATWSSRLFPSRSRVLIRRVTPPSAR